MATPAEATEQDDHDEVGAALSPIARLLTEAIERIERDGAGGLDAVCADHPEEADELRRRIGSLGQIGLLQPARAFGPYRLLRTLGRGGMGVVYLAHDERLGRTVALKALPAQLSGNPRALERFRREVRAVAQLQHPGIVPIFDVGTEDGVPWFTMEYVEGHTLEDLMEGLRSLDLPAEKLTAGHLLRQDARSYIEAACRLVLDVADALAHAHEHGVVHRDVKPSNLLVGADGRARLFDFGLARLAGEASMTLTGDFAGTPFYVSPEQAGAHSETLDPRTDVFSLGITLYELLTLRRPFTGTTTAEVLRSITSEEPPLLRRANPVVPADLQTICQTALEKDPGRRYASAAEMAADLRRLLEFRPVVARPVGSALRAARWVRRNRAVALAGALGAVLLVGGPLLLWRTNIAIRGEAERALSALEDAQEATARQAAVTDFMRAMLRRANPGEVGSELTVADMLRRGAEAVGTDLAAYPRAQITVRQILGNAFYGLGCFEEAYAQLKQSYDQVLAGGGPCADMLYVSVCNLSAPLTGLGRLDEAEAFAREALALAREQGLTGDALADALSNLAIVRQMKGDRDGVIELFREVAELQRVAAGEDGYAYAKALNNLALVAPHEESVELLRKVVVILEAQAEPAPMLSSALLNLGVAEFQSGRPAEGSALLRRAVDLQRQRFGKEHPETADAQVALGMMLVNEQAWAEVEALMRPSIEIYRVHAPACDSKRASALWRLAAAVEAQGRVAEAEAPLREAIAITAPDEPGQPTWRDLCIDLSTVLRALGRSAEADEAFQQAAPQP